MCYLIVEKHAQQACTVAYVSPSVLDRTLGYRMSGPIHAPIYSCFLFMYCVWLHSLFSQDMEEFVQSSGEEGIVVFSLGSMIKNLTMERANTIASGLGQIPQKVHRLICCLFVLLISSIVFVSSLIIDKYLPTQVLCVRCHFSKLMSFQVFKGKGLVS